MDVKEKVAAIKTAVALPRGGNTSPELVRSAYTMLSFLAGFMLSAARLLGSGSPFGVAARGYTERAALSERDSDT